MTRRKRGAEGLTSLAGLLGGAMPRGAPADLATWKLVAWWRRFAGRPLADHVWPARLERGVLTLSADSSTWANEASFLRETLLERLKQEMPALRVRGVRTVLGLARPSLGVEPPEPPAASAPRASGPPLPRELAVALSRVGDDRLRAVIARAARVALGEAEVPADAGEKKRRPR